MFGCGSIECRESWRRARKSLLPAAALVLTILLVLPAKAVNERAVKTREAPIYPEIAKRMRIGGAVRLAVIVNAQGKVKEVRPLSGNHILELAAEDAVRKWIFEPSSGDTTEVVAVYFTIGQ